MTGYTYEELIGMNGLLLVSEDSREMVLRNIEGGYEKPYEAEGVRKKGKLYPLRIEAREIKYKGQDVGVAEFRDITESKLAEKEKERLEAQLYQVQKMDSVGRLAGGVAHDFNNMLTVILGYAEMALKQTEPGQQFHDYWLAVHDAAERSANLTRQLLAFARKQTIEPRVIDLNATVEEMLKMLRRLIGENVDLLWKPEGKLGTVNVDPSQIDQILANLCVNARDAIENAGKIVIETERASFDEAYCAAHPGFVPGDYVQLSVSDNGCGMDAETLSQIFDPFFTTKERGKGTGLGLPSVYGAVQQNNGFIDVRSEVGRGTTFSVYLPLYKANKTHPEEEAAETPNGVASETVLLVEDESAILSVTAMALENLGYVVIPAETPGEAIRLAQERNGAIDLLMTDVVMPEMNGRDLAKNLLTANPGIKCLFMSGYTADVIAHHGVLYEGVHFIQKPFSLENLELKLGEVLDEKTGA
ncbi:MAG: response regulator [Opitutales bacterium]|nr:response regulator [Opitutales bacterium]